MNKKRINKNLTVEKLKEMYWEDYEELIKSLFEEKGFVVKRIGGHGSDGGIDLIIKKRYSKSKSMVQCKRYKNNVGVKIVREMYAVGVHHGFKQVYIYTTADFSKEAQLFAKGKNIILRNGLETIKEIKKLKFH